MVITQEMDESGGVMGFFVPWVRELSKHFDEVEVLFFKGGGARVPSNVKLMEIKGNKLKKTLELNREILKSKPDRIFIHMCPEFVLASLPASLLAKSKRYLWYMHGSVPLKLKVAGLFVEKIFTGSDKSLRLKTKKKVVLHHGIDTGRFFTGEGKSILDVARISQIKNHDVVISAFSKIEKKDLELRIVGDEPPGEQGVMERLKEVAKAKGVERSVVFMGKVPNAKVPGVFAESLFFVSASETGSLDKSGLEAMAAGKAVIVCNEAYEEILQGFEKECFFRKGDETDLAKKMETFIEDDELREKIGKELKERVVEQHSIKKLAKRLSEEMG